MLAGLLDLVAPPRCPGCGARARPPWCERCARGARRLRLDQDVRAVAGLDTVVARYRYTGVIARAIVAGKARGATAVWPTLAIELADSVRRRAPAVDLVVPVPTDRRRARRRGVDHTLVLARGVARRLAVPAVAGLRVRSGLPDRGRDGSAPPLPADAVACVVRLGGARVLLVDDVVTTGTTARACALALRAAGAAQVHLAVVASAHSRRGP